eukprot:CAMPEP_0181310140 /NCGR_PEP_ID=MMETSP1101-20121128/12422_1 /TAXON_ID=46948 /ORGANISM="Rhodomonas abbreviata, Strain Caron Lab Isolate" /LENGTH=185 /DNA_ID=CAMNT_0023416739 /DNA_START=188 /DNA_END=745 /DNA_ORIENTATION=-
MVFVLSCVEATGSSKDVALQTSVEKSSLQHGPSLSVKSKGEALHAQKSAGVALAAVKGGKTVESAAETKARQQKMAARFQEVHQKALAKSRLGVKAEETFENVDVKKVKEATDWMPFVLPPIGLCLLAGITFGVISIRKWQKIPSMPQQGRMDIKDVQASARQAGTKADRQRGEQKEMKQAWEGL